MDYWEVNGCWREYQAPQYSAFGSWKAEFCNDSGDKYDRVSKDVGSYEAGPEQGNDL